MFANVFRSISEVYCKQRGNFLEVALHVLFMRCQHINFNLHIIIFHQVLISDGRNFSSVALAVVLGETFTSNNEKIIKLK